MTGIIDHDSAATEIKNGHLPTHIKNTTDWATRSVPRKPESQVLLSQVVTVPLRQALVQ